MCVPSCVYMCLCLSMQASVYVSSSDTLCFHLRLPLGTGRWCQPQCLKNCPLGACDSLRVCHDGRAGRLVCVFMATGVLCASKRAGSFTEQGVCVGGGRGSQCVYVCVCPSQPTSASLWPGCVGGWAPLMLLGVCYPHLPVGLHVCMFPRHECSASACAPVCLHGSRHI